MYFVYILRSAKNPEKIYIGYTPDVELRLQAHNDGKSIYTNKYKPWVLEGYVAFKDETKAIAFEKYLKSGSGKALVNKHFV